MQANEKAELLKNTIIQLYCKEGRSKSYIGRLLEINRQTIAKKIREWELPEPKPKRRATPSTQKFINKNRQKIKNMLDNDYTLADIAKELNVTRDKLKTVFEYDNVLMKAKEDNQKRKKDQAGNKINRLKEASLKQYDIEDLEGEIWKPILGYEKYMVSNMGRIKAYAKTYNDWYLLTPTPNIRTGRLYVSLDRNDGKRKNLLLHRVVAHAFIEGYSEDANTVNHKNGVVDDCRASNLEWVSQSENNKHSYRTLNRRVNNQKRYQFDKILYKGRYEFKTIAAFARFLNMSETQTRRYLDEPEKHKIQLIHNCND